LKDYFIGDSVRDKCLEMLVTALMADQADGQNPDELIINTAQSIEKSLFNEFKTISPAYKSKFRSKYLNLKDKNNPTLRSGLISGMITPDRFISMSSAEMASEDRRRVDSMIAEQNMLNSQMAKDNAAETDQFKCGRCNQRKCKYYQMQTRSADEPMTTFVTCVNCGNRWRVRFLSFLNFLFFLNFNFSCHLLLVLLKIRNE
jgi:transcription elongation factor S-II